MKRLNYHHLLYFWTVVRAGSVSAASRELGVSQPTVSEQVRMFERELGQKLFQRAGRNLAVTDFGRMVFRHANRIFRGGDALMEAIRKYRRASPRAGRSKLAKKRKK